MLVGIRDVPNKREYWYYDQRDPRNDITMHNGLPRKLSGGSSSRRRARTNDNAEMVRDAARVTWSLRAGVGSSSRRKKGFRLRTTAMTSDIPRNASYDCQN